MGVLDKLLDAVKLNDDYDDDFLDDEDDFLDDEDEDDYLEAKPKKSFFSKFTSRVKDTDEDDFDDLDDLEPVKPRTKITRSEKKETEKESSSLTSKSYSSSEKDSDKEDKNIKQTKTSSKITPMRSAKRSNNTGMEVCVIKPRSMEDTREIADTLLDNSTIILNLEGIDVDLAQRITDFSSGACYSLGGRLQRISGYIFVIVPYNVDITGDLQNVLGGAIPSVRAGY